MRLSPSFASLRGSISTGVVGAATVALIAAAFWGHGVASAETAAACSQPGRVFIVGGTWNSDGSYLVGIEQRYTGHGAHWEELPDSPYSGAGAYEIEQVPYSATIWPLGSVGYNASEAEGSANLEQAVAAYQQQCGADKKIVIAGYSQGARIAGDVLTDIGANRSVTMDDGSTYVISTTDSDGARTVSGELYSDPRMSATLWGQGIEATLVGIIPGLTMSGTRAVTDYGGLPVTTYCIAGDPICDLPDPFHDPIGDLDALLGYWVKHGQYPFHMYQFPGTGTTWYMNGANEPMTCTQSGSLQTCTIASPSSMVILAQNLVDALGLHWSVPDLVACRFRLPDIIGITLADFQPPIRWVMDWFPPLPQLGYGAYLPDLYAFENTINGALTWNRELFEEGVQALLASGKSIVALPLNFVKYWAARVVEGITTVPRGSTSAGAGATVLSTPTQVAVPLLASRQSAVGGGAGAVGEEAGAVGATQAPAPESSVAPMSSTSPEPSVSPTSSTSPESSSTTESGATSSQSETSSQESSAPSPGETESGSAPDQTTVPSASSAKESAAATP